MGGARGVVSDLTVEMKEEDCDSSEESIESPLTRNTEKLTCSENEIDLTIKPSLMREVLVR